VTVFGLSTFPADPSQILYLSHVETNAQVVRNPIVSEIYSYHTDWKEGKVNQMWIEQITDKECDNLFVAVAHNPRNGSTMEMSNPRTSYHETLQWVRKWCGTFCILPA
jgi:hypothetical protein